MFITLHHITSHFMSSFHFMSCPYFISCPQFMSSFHFIISFHVMISFHVLISCHGFISCWTWLFSSPCCSHRSTGFSLERNLKVTPADQVLYRWVWPPHTAINSQECQKVFSHQNAMLRHQAARRVNKSNQGVQYQKLSWIRTTPLEAKKQKIRITSKALIGKIHGVCSKLWGIPRLYPRENGVWARKILPKKQWFPPSTLWWKRRKPRWHFRSYCPTRHWIERPSICVILTGCSSYLNSNPDFLMRAGKIWSAWPNLEEQGIVRLYVLARPHDDNSIF